SAIVAYLQGYEPLEARLRARDPQATAAVEGAFRDLRASISRGDRAAVDSDARRLDRLLADGRVPSRPLVPFAAAFLIYLREGLEAALLVGALLAGVRGAARPRLGGGGGGRALRDGRGPRHEPHGDASADGTVLRRLERPAVRPRDQLRGRRHLRPRGRGLPRAPAGHVPRDPLDGHPSGPDRSRGPAHDRGRDPPSGGPDPA